jgi:hypothetical protein
MFANELLRRLRGRGFTSYAEPCAGGFALARVAVAAGYPPDSIETSDVGLFGSVLGSLFSDRPLAQLDLKLDGEPLELPDEPVQAAAVILLTQLELRLAKRPDVRYWNELRADLETRRDQHRMAIAQKLNGMLGELHGIAYEPLSLIEHLDRVADDAFMVANVNPPSYMGAYERFFDTGDRLTWAEPPYDVFDPATDFEKLYERYRDAKMLLLVQLQREAGKCPWPRPFYARPQGYEGASGNTYYVANRPDDVLSVIGGQPLARPRVYDQARPLAVPMFGYQDELAEKPEIDVVPVSAPQARYYKQLWMHRGIGWADGSANFAVLVDGKIAGVGGYSADTVLNSYAESSLDTILLRFATGAPHIEHRLTRFVAKLALQRSTIETALFQSPSGPIALACANRVITAEFTRHPEQKNQRGLMKLRRRERKEGRYHLIYEAPIEELTPVEVLAFWRRKEKQWRQSRKKQPATSSS